MNLSDIRKLLEDVTKGPWSFDEMLYHVNDQDGDLIATIDGPHCTVEQGRFIAAARTVVPELCDRVEQLERENRLLRNVTEMLGRHIHNLPEHPAAPLSRLLDGRLHFALVKALKALKALENHNEKP